mmetsp:Transcript_36/g.66  ORF Transcript_36/g.66 Transcript_36/m.66 type:complete len:93 (+) Transcript_36:501-779(+)
MQSMMIRILFIWAVRHPASAYVQGINDLCAPLLLVFLSEFVLKADKNELALHNSVNSKPQISNYPSVLHASAIKEQSASSRSTEASQEDQQF